MAVENQKQFQEAVEKAIKSSPLAGVVEKAMNLGSQNEEPEEEPEEELSEKDLEIMELKQQLADIQSKIAKLDE